MGVEVKVRLSASSLRALGEIAIKNSDVEAFVEIACTWAEEAEKQLYNEKLECASLRGRVSIDSILEARVSYIWDLLDTDTAKTPKDSRVIDLCYSAFMRGTDPNKDWSNDTLPGIKDCLHRWRYRVQGTKTEEPTPVMDPGP